MGYAPMHQQTNVERRGAHGFLLKNQRTESPCMTKQKFTAAGISKNVGGVQGGEPPLGRWVDSITLARANLTMAHDKC